LLLTIIIIILLALLLLGLVIMPLLAPGMVDPLPDFRDPVTVDLEEERDALLRAIRELDGRGDLAAGRREQLRQRYEAKAAAVLQALDRRKAAGAVGEPEAPAATGRRVPYGALGLAGLAVITATLLGTWVLPRVGPNATVTSFFQRDVDAAIGLRNLQRAAASDPSTANLLALADAWWQLNEPGNAAETYLRITKESDPVPALAWQRLGLLALEQDPALARDYLERASQAGPADLETLFFLAELNFSFGNLAAAHEAWTSLLPLPGADEVREYVTARLALLDELTPLLAAVQETPDRDNLLQLAEAFWTAGEQERAVDVYFRILTEVDPLDPQALGRTGQLLFLRGRVDDAVMLLERAVSSGHEEPDALLFLGNGQFSLGNYNAAIAAWEQYLTVVPVEDAGRVPGLIAEAQARLAGSQPSEVLLEMPAAAQAQAAEAAEVDPLAQGRDLFVANCASCHAAAGTGGTGPALLNNPRAARAANVESLVRFGRGRMPGFNARLTDSEIELITEFVTVGLAGN
jgi:mono/diheme cytochrome c family protein